MDVDGEVDLDEEPLLRYSFKGIKPLVHVLGLEKNCHHLRGS